ncbi:MAG: DUF4845 domain-containing protein [Gammaproteobacteria bacterium]|jgi:hypothetical protein|nr:DUF4845 domain-containing protein [Gammaproteobacteria bacterium]
MNKTPGNQKGAAVVTILVLAIIAYAIFVGIQYIPLQIESSAVDSILTTIEESEKTARSMNTGEVKNKINGLLNINQMDDMADSFKVSKYRDDFIVEVSYDRELNLLYQKKLMPYRKKLTL